VKGARLAIQPLRVYNCVGLFFGFYFQIALFFKNIEVTFLPISWFLQGRKYPFSNHSADLPFLVTKKNTFIHEKHIKKL